MIKGVKFVNIPVADQARALKFEFLAPPKKEPWGTSVMFKDSEGNSLHLGSA